MSLTNEDLLSISQLLDSKLKPVNVKTSNYYLKMIFFQDFKILNLAILLHIADILTEYLNWNLSKPIWTSLKKSLQNILWNYKN